MVRPPPTAQAWRWRCPWRGDVSILGPCSKILVLLLKRAASPFVRFQTQIIHALQPTTPTDPQARLGLSTGSDASVDGASFITTVRPSEKSGHVFLFSLRTCS